MTRQPVAEHCFFILGLGRSGTHRLATLLNTHEHARVLHEPYQLDTQILTLSWAGGFCRGLEGMLRERFRRLLYPCAAPIYGEANSYLRFVGPWLERELGATTLRIARDGRDFVTSAHIRPIYTMGASTLAMLPSDSDSFSSFWPDLTRFEKLAWYWRATNERLLTQGPVLKTEEILRDWDAFRGSVVQATQVPVEERQWRAAAKRKTNSSINFRRRQLLRSMARGRRQTRPTDIGRWDTWSTWQTERFWEIAGDTMSALGYS